jgi:uncharacterized membrane protein YkoI
MMSSPTADASTENSTDPGPPRPFWRRSWLVVGCVTGALVLGAAAAGAGIIDDDTGSEAVEQESEASEDVANAPADAISQERAGQLAVEAAGGGTVTDLDLDEDGGVVVYEVEVQRTPGDESSEAEVLVDARTGDIVSVSDDPIDDDEEPADDASPDPNDD